MGILDYLARRRMKSVQGETTEQRLRDYRRKGESFSVEDEISEALADLVLMMSSFPISGDSARATWLDGVSDSFMRTEAKKAVVSAFVTGDCIVVPSWNGRNIQNMIVPSNSFEIFDAAGDEILSCGYVLDTAKVRNQRYYLVQSVELKEQQGGGYANVYRTYATRGEGEEPVSVVPQWADRYDPEWSVPNVERLLIGRYKSFTYDPIRPNNAKGAPICFGAGAYIDEIHYLLDQMHTEFGFSEKAIMASKRMFETGDATDANGRPTVEIPRGRRRQFMFTRASAKGDSEDITEWAPDIRYQAYLEAIDKQEQLVERAVGVSGGIISRPNDMNYQNVDNVRKSQQKTMGFVSTARKQAEQMLTQLVYAWDVLANYYSVTPAGSYEPSFDWSSEWIETFADKQNAILAGISVGATDAVDYRVFLYNEPPETAREKVAEIAAGFEDEYTQAFTEEV